MQIAVLFGYRLQGSGSAVYTAELVRTLADQGHQVTLFCAAQPNESDPRTQQLLLRNLPATVRIEARHLPEAPVTYIRPDMPQAPFLAEIAPAQANAYIDQVETWLSAVQERTTAPFELILVQHLGLLACVAERFSRRHGCPYRVIAHGTALHYGVRRSQAIKQLLRPALQRADQIVALNETSAQDVLRTFPDLNQTLAIAPPGTDTHLFQPGVPDMQRIAYVGRLSLDKGVHCLLAAFARMAAQDPTAVLHIAGGGPDAQALRDAWQALASGRQADFLTHCRRAAGTRPAPSAAALLAPVEVLGDMPPPGPCAEDQVRWLGLLGRGEVAQLVGSSALTVLPALVPEAHPLAVCEALAAQTPVVGTDAAGIRHILQRLEEFAPDVAGRLRIPAEPSRFVEQLAERCLDLLETPLSAESRRLARRFISSNYSWRKTARVLTGTQRTAASAMAVWEDSDGNVDGSGLGGWQGQPHEERVAQSPAHCSR